MGSENPENKRQYPSELRTDIAIANGFLNDYSMRSYLAAQRLSACGRHWNAIMAIRHGLEYDPNDLRLHIMLVVSYCNLQLNQEAELHLAHIGRCNPSPEITETIKAYLRNYQYIPDTVGALPFGDERDSTLFTNSLLGFDGAFGNQFFQYIFGKLYSEKHGMQFETYDWIGKQLFGINEPSISKILPFMLDFEFIHENTMILSPTELGICGRDTQGYLQLNTKIYQEFKHRFANIFRPILVVEGFMQSFLHEIRNHGNSLVVMHIRRGDAATQGRGTNPRIYLDWLKARWATLEKPVLYIASDDVKGIRADFSEFHPFITEKAWMPIPNADFYPDFYMLSQGDYLLAGNSTFSFAASMLNTRAKEIMRPNAENTSLVPYDPWNALPTV